MIRSCAVPGECPVYSAQASSFAGRRSKQRALNKTRLVLRHDLGSEGLSYDLSVPYDKCIGSEFVRIICCFCRPENVRVISLNTSQLHGEGGARLFKLRSEDLKKLPNRVWTF